MRFLRPALAALGFVLVAGVAQAQQLHVMRESVIRPAASEDRALVERVREDLAKVKAAEEVYFAANKTYASELADLKGLKLSSGTSVIIMMSGPMGWKAEATHPSLQGAEVLHVMRAKDGEAGCPMMGAGGMGGGMGGGMMGGMGGMGGMHGGMGGGRQDGCCAGQPKAAPKAPAAEQHQH